MRCKIVLAVVFGALVAPAAFASGNIDVSGLIQPGLYEISTQMNVQGVGEMPARTSKHCVTQDDVKNYAKNLAAHVKKAGGKVQVKDLSLHGKDLHFTMTTAKGSMDFDIIFDDPTHYHQILKGVMMGHKMTAKSKGHRIGECKKKADS